MVGPGTGIAPMRALLQERGYMQKEKGLMVGPNFLYFGCKSRSLDYLYEDELKIFQEKGTLTRLYTAFSREQKNKVYVQHLLLENARETWDLMENQGGFIYVCGGVKMGKDVIEALVKIISEVGGLCSTDAKIYVERLAQDGRLVQELWA